MKTLKNVIDTRTGLLHSIAIVTERKEKYFVSTEQPEQVEQPKKTTSKKKKG